MKNMNGKTDAARPFTVASSYRMCIRPLLFVGLVMVCGIFALISADRAGLFSTNKSSILHNEILIGYRNGFYHDELWRRIVADLENVPNKELVLSHTNSEAEFINSQNSSKTGCDYALGRWIKDKKKPLYSGEKCKRWLSGMWACRLMKGRPNFDFENYRWQPDSCDLPAFDAVNFLSRMQNKLVAFIGDSIGRQQYQSLMCMLTGGNDDALVEDVSPLFGLVKPRGAIRADGTAQRFKETNTTILFYWSASLCYIEPLNKTDPNTEFAMHLDQPAAFIQTYLEKMDVLVLNTGHHWNKEKIKANKWELHVNGERNVDDSLRNASIARNYTIHKIIAWLDHQILTNHTRAQIFMRSRSPRHFFNGEWDSGGTCDHSPVPVEKKTIRGKMIGNPGVKSAVLHTRVRLLNVSYLSEFRDEAHISKYGSTQSGQDCLHWCLPGVPDVWNEVLYAELFFGKDSGRMP